jgi:hypothetical protein
MDYSNINGHIIIIQIIYLYQTIRCCSPTAIPYTVLPSLLKIAKCTSTHPSSTNPSSPHHSHPLHPSSSAKAPPIPIPIPNSPISTSSHSPYSKYTLLLLPLHHPFRPFSPSLPPSSFLLSPYIKIKPKTSQTQAPTQEQPFRSVPISTPIKGVQRQLLVVRAESGAQSEFSIVPNQQ